MLGNQRSTEIWPSIYAVVLAKASPKLKPWRGGLIFSTVPTIMKSRSAIIQSQKTQGFCLADFATPSDERKSRSKIFPLFIWMKEPCVRKFEGLARSKLLGTSQTKFFRNSLSDVPTSSIVH